MVPFMSGKGSQRNALSVLASLSLLLVLPLAAQAQQTYVALGDSYAFGYTTSTAAPSNGNQGYASLLRGILDDRNGTQTVDLVNLAIPGETSSSFFAGPTTLVPDADPNDGVDTSIRDGLLRNPGFNTNYASTPTALQSQKFSDLATSLAAQGRQVDYLTLQMGGNDGLNLFVQQGFTNLSLQNQLSLLYNRLQTVETNVGQALAGINVAAPNADVFVIGYADPFVGLGAANPFPTFNFNPFGALGRVNVTSPTALSTLLTLEANVRLAEVAARNGATYVDIYAPFLGRETVYTRILTPDSGTGTPNFHPTPEGYQVIANSIAANVAPEPGTVALLLTGAIPLLGITVRQRK